MYNYLLMTGGINIRQVNLMTKVSIIGATGYAGQELVRLLCGHPKVEIKGLGTQNYKGQPFSDVYPNFRGIVDLPCQGADDPQLIAESDVIFLAMPHGQSVSLAQTAVEQGKKVIGLGADFRLRDPKVYEEWYQTKAAPAEQLAKAVYGLPEVNRQVISQCSLLANPGCYPTTVILALGPLLKEKAIDPAWLIIDSKSGVSGAGRGTTLTTHYCEVNEDFKAYGVPRHRHTPEIEQELSKLAGQEVQVSFTPHLIPATRGMLSTIYTVPLAGINAGKIAEIYQAYYGKEPFIRLLPVGEVPHTKWVSGTNYCDLAYSLDPRTGRLTIFSAIDNLVKGAAGQAVQNMNIMLGLEETLGLPRVAIYP